jgi:hypothetical protein
MSEFFIVLALPVNEHPTLADAEHERDLLAAHVPDKTFKVFRCKEWLHSAQHFPKVVEFLSDLEREGLTAEMRSRLSVLLTTIGTRTPKFKCLRLPKKPLPLVEVSPP